MTEEAEVLPARIERSDQVALAIASAREKLLRLLPRSLQVLEELMDYGENERVRLAAAESIADRAGLTKQLNATVQVTTGEHEAAKAEAELLVAGIKRNQAAIAAGGKDISLEALIVHEAD